MKKSKKAFGRNLFFSLPISSSFKNEMFKRVIRDDGVEVYIANQPRTYNTYMCYTISFLSRNIDLEFNFLYLFKMFRRKSKREKKIRFQLCDDRWVVVFTFFHRCRRRFVEFACCANSFHFSKWKSSVTPIFGIGKTFKFEYNGWLEKGDEEEEKISKWAFGNFGWKRFMLFLLFFFGYERKWKEKTEWEENMSYGWV